jgi:cob(I)alamin adenosyltransferase
MEFSIYTRTGDSGQTSLLGGKRVSKGSLEMRVIGEVDELNASLGVVVAWLDKIEQNEEIEDLAIFIQIIQRDLFKIGAELAAMQGPLVDKIEKIDSVRPQEMERYIDLLWNQLPDLRNFILPGGSVAGAEMHKARTVCRRVERQLVDFAGIVSVRPDLIVYINRLSDFLFAAARFLNAKEGAEEIVV